MTTLQQSYFDTHQTVNVAYFASDGCGFRHRKVAEYYAEYLDNKHIETVTRAATLVDETHGDNCSF